MRRKRTEHRTAILRCLRDAEGGALWVREIGRRTGIHHGTVSRILDDLYIAGLVVDHDFFRQTKGKVRARFVQLKPGVEVK